MSVTRLEYLTNPIDLGEIQLNEDEQKIEIVLDSLHSIVLYDAEEAIHEMIENSIAKTAEFQELCDMIEIESNQSSVLSEKIPDRLIRMAYDRYGRAFSKDVKQRGMTKFKSNLIELAEQKGRMHEIKAVMRDAINQHDGKHHPYFGFKSNYARVPQIVDVTNVDERSLLRTDYDAGDIKAKIVMDTKEIRSTAVLKISLKDKPTVNSDYKLIDSIPNREMSITVKRVNYDVIGRHAREKLEFIGLSEAAFLKHVNSLVNKVIILRDVTSTAALNEVIISGKCTLHIGTRHLDVVAKLNNVDAKGANVSFIITIIEASSETSKIIATNFPWMPLNVLSNVRASLSEDMKSRYFSQVVMVPNTGTELIVNEDLMKAVHDTEPWSMLNYTKMRKWIINNRKVDTLSSLQRDTASMVTIFRGALEFIDIKERLGSNTFLKVGLSDAFDKLVRHIIIKRGNSGKIADHELKRYIKLALLQNVGISVQEAETVRMMQGTYPQFSHMIPEQFTLESYKMRVMLALLTRVYSRTLQQTMDKELSFDYISGSDLQLTSLPYSITEKEIIIYEAGPEMMTLLTDYKSDSKAFNSVKNSTISSKSKIIRTGTSGYQKVASFTASLIAIKNVEQRRKHVFTLLINNVEVALTEIIAKAVNTIYSDIPSPAGTFVIWHPKFTLIFVKNIKVTEKRCEVFIIPSTRASRIQKPLHNWPVYSNETGTLYPANLYTGGTGYMYSWLKDIN